MYYVVYYHEDPKTLALTRMPGMFGYQHYDVACHLARQRSKVEHCWYHVEDDNGLSYEDYKDGLSSYEMWNPDVVQMELAL